MCTPLEAEQAAVRALTKVDDEGKTIVEREVEAIVNRAVTKLTYRFGIAVIVMAFGFGGAIALQSKAVEENTRARTQGDRYTQEEHDAYAREVNLQLLNINKEIVQLRTDTKEDIAEIKSDIGFIRHKLGG